MKNNRLPLKNILLKPEFLFRPTQLLRRLRWKRRWCGKRGTAILPWGLPLEIDAAETIGMAISKVGVYDLMVAEALLRLADPGETALDIGANIGMNTGALALAVGAEGKVFAFEPHPSIHQGLQRTIGNWASPEYGICNIELRAEAVSDTAGSAVLKVPRDFSQNIGIASLTDAHFDKDIQTDDIEVPVISLDEAFADLADKIGVMKIDIEGHELAAFHGAERLLSVGCIRDIIFEEHEILPTAVSRLLEDHGYTIFLLRKDTLGPHIIPTPCERPHTLPNYLATLEPDRALLRFKKRGFASLKKHRSLSG